jgi:hypothetical protein
MAANRQLSDDDDLEEHVFPQTNQAHAPTVTPSVATNIYALHSGGSPLPKTTRAFFEPRFGVDFNHVRVHTDSRAAETANSLNARAFTFGRSRTRPPILPPEQVLLRMRCREIDSVSRLLRTPDINFDDLAKSYKNVEDSFLPKVAGNQFLTLETKRRVSELMLYSAIEKECSFELCHSLFDELSQLGFTNLEKKSSVYLIYSRYCLELGQSNHVTRLLEQLEVELEDELRRSDVLVYRQLLQTILDVLKDLRRQA